MIGEEHARLLTCAALEPGLDGVLLLDLPAGALRVAAEFVAHVLRRTGRQPRVVVLGSHEDDDQLWLSYRVHLVDGVVTFVPVGGPLVSEGPVVVVVPDLARLSLAAARAAVTILGAPAVLLERHGVSRTVPNSTFWLASCASDQIGQVSPHLLDRFALRVPAATWLAAEAPVDRVRNFLNGSPAPTLAVPSPPQAWLDALTSGDPAPECGEAVLTTALELPQLRRSTRRALAFLRLARGFARMDGAGEAGWDQLREAGRTTGLLIDAGDPLPDKPPEPTQPEYQPEQPTVPDLPAPAQAARPAPAGTSETVAEPAQAPVLAGAPMEALGPAAAPVPADPYPEDSAEPDREAAPLALPWRRAGKPADRGEVIGTAPADRLVDLNWVATLREAAKYRRIRGANGPWLSPSDLRRHRRRPRPESLLVLLLDHTCRRGWDWLSAMADHLRHAYVRRAAVCVVEVGASWAVSPLRAEQQMLRGLLDPRLSDVFERPPGSATPLAHGLELARLALCHALRHGHTPVGEAVLVVATDGLGNVPLSASLRGAVTGPVGAEGVDDALAVCREIAELDRVRPVVVVPPHAPYPELCADLARALGPRGLVVSEAG